MMDKTDPNKSLDYASLLKCWSMIKTSELLREIATNQMKSLKSEDSIRDRVKNFSEKIDSKTTLKQTIAFWNQTVEEFLNQNNFLEAAECLESLSEIQSNYGSNDEKNDSTHSLRKASKFYKKASDKKRAIIALKRALTIDEFSPDRNVKKISKKYEECELLYKDLDLNHLSKLNHKISDFFGEMTPLFQSPQKESKSLTVSAFISTNSDHKHMKRSAQFSKTNYSMTSNSDIGSDDQIEEQIDSKELVRKQINEMMATSSVSIDDESESDDNSEESHFQYMRGSHKLLRQNLKNIFSNSFTKSEDSEDSNENSNERHPKRITDKESLTTEITAVPPTTPIPSPVPLNNTETEIKAKRKRKHKPKEESEETPINRLKKLERENYLHDYYVDPVNPSKRLKCSLCNEPIQCYRWSTVVDHLETKRHNQMKERVIASLIIGKQFEKSVIEENNSYSSQKYIQNQYNCYQLNESLTESLPMNPSNNDFIDNLSLNSYQTNSYPSMVSTEDINSNNKCLNPYSLQMPSTSTQLNPIHDYPTINFDELLQNVGIPQNEELNVQLFDDRSTLNTPDPNFA